MDVPSDREGVLQDTHWADALFGYFPSYALGSAYGAHMLHVMRQTVDVDAALASGDLSPINGWLCERIWQYGGLYEPETLLSRGAGRAFRPDVLCKLSEKQVQRNLRSRHEPLGRSPAAAAKAGCPHMEGSPF